MSAVILLGPPGVGKGTQAKWLAEALDIPAISTGQIFRTNIADGTELGKLAQIFIDHGEFVPDTITNPMVEARLGAPDAKKGFVLDGYPRSLPQAHALRDVLAKEDMHLDAVLELTAPEEVLVDRMKKRAGEEHRADDRDEVFEHRIAVYHERTEPLATYYADLDLLDVIDASGSFEEVARLMLDALRERGICE